MIFWADTGPSHNNIERANYDGTDRRVIDQIADTEFTIPTDIAIDDQGKFSMIVSKKLVLIKLFIFKNSLEIVISGLAWPRGFIRQLRLTG